MSWYKKQEDRLRKEYINPPVFIIKTNGIDKFNEYMDVDKYNELSNNPIGSEKIYVELLGNAKKHKIGLTYMNRNIKSKYTFTENEPIELYSYMLRGLITSLCDSYRITNADFNDTLSIFIEKIYK